MPFIIADTFYDSLGRLNAAEQKTAKQAAFDLYANPKGDGFKMHRVERSRDKHFWSARVGADIRFILHKMKDSLLLCFVGHHDPAYAWAERHAVQVHPKTGAAQLLCFETVRVEEVAPSPPVTPDAPSAKPLFAAFPDTTLSTWGVPPESLPTIRAVTNENQLLDLFEVLPDEALEALLSAADGRPPQLTPSAKSDGETRSAKTGTETNVAPLEPATQDIGSKITDQAVEDLFNVGDALPESTDAQEADTLGAFTHPDAARRFHVVESEAELTRALEGPWAKWSIFLHPKQRELVEKTYTGPARIVGTAGTGKTVVALHRTAFLARRHSDARVLLTSFSPVLVADLAKRMRHLVAHEPRLLERIDIVPLATVAERLHAARAQAVSVASEADVDEALDRALAVGPSLPPGLSRGYLRAEWTNTIDAFQIQTQEAYAVHPRPGRKIRLAEERLHAVWAVMETVRCNLAEAGKTTQAEIYARLAREILPVSTHPPYDFIVMDEAQDIGPMELALLAALGRHRPDSLFFTGDPGQRIFHDAFSWARLGVTIDNIHPLTLTYRTSFPILRLADQLMPREITDGDGLVVPRPVSVSLLPGQAPSVRAFAEPNAEIEATAAWLSERRREGIEPHEIAVFVRSTDELPRAIAAVERAGTPAVVLNHESTPVSGALHVATMHHAKGLEYRAVAVMACDDGVIPRQTRLDEMAEISDLQNALEAERHLLYVACTRARDALWISATKPTSDYFSDICDMG